MTTTKPCRAATEIGEQLRAYFCDPRRACLPGTSHLHEAQRIAQRVGRFDEQRALLTEALESLHVCRCHPKEPCRVCKLRRRIVAHLSLIGGEDGE